jgi:surface antigen Omp85-like protein
MSARTLIPALWVVLLACAAPARANEAPDSAAADTALGHYFDQLSDSTTQYFGIAAEPTDTAGLDTVLSDSGAERRRITFGGLPAFAFNRADGPTFGATATIETPVRRRRTGPGRLGGKLAWAAGSRTWLGGGEYQNTLHLGTHAFGVRAFGGRVAARMNRDHFGRFLDTWRALIWGGDGSHYLREDGFEVGIDHDTGVWRAAARFRDMLDRPLPVTASWDLTHRPLLVPFNLAAERGRTHELGLDADWRWGRLPIRSELQGWVGGAGLGGDLDYHRVRAAIGAELPVRRTLAVVPQLLYGRMTGTALPQEAFYLGGGPTLRSMSRDALGGTHVGLARLDAVLVPDLLMLLHLPHSAALPVQGAVFGATGAVWGRDPYGGPGSAEDAWPARAAWRSETGVTLLYASALLGATSFVNISLAWPVGNHPGPPRFTFGLSRTFDLQRPPSE